MGCGASYEGKSGLDLKGNAPSIIPAAEGDRLVAEGCVQSPMRSRSPNTELGHAKPRASGEAGPSCPPTPPVKARPSEAETPPHRRPSQGSDAAPHPLADKLGVISQAPLPLPKVRLL